MITKLLKLLGSSALLILITAQVALADVLPEKGIGYPRDVSLDGYRIDWLINVTFVFVALLFIIMCVWMVAACVLYGPNHKALYDHGNAKNQTAVALAMSAAIFFVVDGNLFYHSIVDVNEAFWNFEKADNDPDVLRLEINARQWAWNARYAGPDGKFNTQDDIVTLNDIYVPIDRPVLVQLAAVDVIHAFYLPNLRVKTDAVPGVINQLWFQAKETGEFDIGCAQHCGTHHYKMKGKLIILPQNEYNVWEAEASKNAALAFDEADTQAQWGWTWKRKS